ncbi:hypothetical protein PMAYCL1PPCAC_21596, partial [Pristionchus mayeri]
FAGTAGVMSVVGYIVVYRFPLRECQEWILIIGMIFNTFGSIASTIAKFYMALHRFLVLRNGQLLEVTQFPPLFSRLSLFAKYAN